MKQQKLEEKVRKLFERQRFKLEEIGNGFKAEKEDLELSLKVFSSEKHNPEDVEEKISEEDKVFIDRALSSVENILDNEVSVLEEDEEEPEFETPSYEVIGDIAVISDLAGVEREEAVEGILHHQNVKTILLKIGGLRGEFRVGEYEKLYGEETETVHKEFGCDYRVDPTKVYFSERFSTERKRVVDQIEDGEKVLVMFAGVGPFAVMAGKLADPEKVVAVEKNPVAAHYLKENIKLNNLEDTVEGYHADVREIIPELDEKFDRVIMPLPGSATDFLDLVVECTKKGSVVHCYLFNEGDEHQNVMENLEYGEYFSLMNFTVCGDRSPSEQRICLNLIRRFIQGTDYQ